MGRGMSFHLGDRRRGGRRRNENIPIKYVAHHG